MPRVEKNSLFLTKESSNKTSSNPVPGSIVRNTFKKEERLKSKKLIELLFKNGNIISAPPLKFLWIPTQLDTSFPMQIAFSAPKKHFPKAVDRNRIKRLCKEAYRLNKKIAYDHLYSINQKAAGMLIYTGRQTPTLEAMKAKIILILERFTKDYETFQ